MSRLGVFLLGLVAGSLLTFLWAWWVTA